jgi:hypothetical protein
MELQYTTDTSDEAYWVQIGIFRKLSPQQRIEQASKLSNQLRIMAMNAIRKLHPDWDEADVKLAFIETAHGKKLADEMREAYRNNRNALR